MNVSKKNRAKILLTTIHFFLVGICLFYVLTPVPAGNWVGEFGVYSQSPIFWVFATATVAILGVYATREYASWNWIWFVGSIWILLIPLLMLRYGTFYANHDPWIHLARTQFDITLGRESYRGFYALLNVLNRTSGIQIKTLLLYLPVGVGICGLVFQSALLRRTDFESRVKKLLIVLSLPAVFLRFNQRPMALAWPLLLLILWYLWAVTSDSLLQKEARILALLLFLGALSIHPSAGIIAVVLTAGFVIAQKIGKRDPTETIKIRSRKRVLMLWSLVLMLTTYLVIANSVGISMISRLIGASTAGGATDTATSSGAASDPLLVRLLSSPDVFIAGLNQAHYPLLIFVCLALAAVIVIMRGKVEAPLVGYGLAIAGVSLTFVFLDIAGYSGMNVTRFLFYGPVLLLIGVGLIFEYGSSGILQVTVCALLILSGMGYIYYSPLSGGVEKHPTKKTETGAQWIHEYGSESQKIGGADRMMYALYGLYGPKAFQDRTGFILPSSWRLAGYNRYAWRINKSDTDLYLVDSVDRLRADREKIDTFVSNNCSIYDNGPGRIIESCSNET